jgi:Relaxase/Mobilisation nuclease domain.
MNPVKIGLGKSFKGLAAYLLHDPERAQTADRVAWAESYNLDGADPEKAWRLMAATALSADQLKAAAGIKKGKPVTNTAYHFAITFNPEDRPSGELERAAVLGALKALGLDKHQALAVSHRDTDHHHVHVMVNLIDPETGLSAASKGRDGSPALLSNDTRKLSQWAQAFEREHRLAITEGRLKNADLRAQGVPVDARRKPRNVYERQKSETTDRRRDFAKRDFRDQAADLAAEGRQMHERHQSEWAALNTTYRAEKEAAYTEFSKAMKRRAAELHEQQKPAWAAIFSRQRDERRDFEQGERSALGRIWHGAAVFRDRARDGDALGGFLAAFMKDERLAIVQRKHDRERATLSLQLRAAAAEEFDRMKKEASNARASHRLRYLSQCDELKKRQAEARTAMKGRWRAYNRERAVALSTNRAQQARPQRERSQQFARGRGLEPS